MPTIVIAVGDVMLDVAADRGPHPHAASIRSSPGGAAANLAVWAASAGAEATVVGRVGDDLTGAAIRAALEEHGVRPHLVVDPELPTGTVIRIDGELVVDRGANRRLEVSDLPPLDVDAILVSGFALLQPDSAPAGRAALAGGAPWTAATAGSAGLIRRAGPEALAGARVLVANAAEAEALTGSNPHDAARALAARYELACVTLGAEGALLAHGGELLSAPAAERVEGPAHGAGDAFAAALLVALARKAGPADALAQACRAGARAAAGGWPPLDS